jgi:hypothetical protein
MDGGHHSLGETTVTELGHRVDGGRPGDIGAGSGPPTAVDRAELLRARQLVLGRLSRPDADDLTVQLAKVMAEAPYALEPAGARVGDEPAGGDRSSRLARNSAAEGEAAGADRGAGWAGQSWETDEWGHGRRAGERAADRRDRPLVERARTAV